MEQRKVLVLDDDNVIREGLRRILDPLGYRVETFSSGHPAIMRMKQEAFDLVLSDLKMPGMNGMDVLRTIRALQPEVPIIMITGYATVDTAVEAMKCGAFDFVAKPFTPEQIGAKVAQALEQSATLLDDLYVRKELRDHQGFDHFVGTSPEMQRVYHRILQVAPTESTVLVTGESGTGKELVARAVHDNSPRREQAFVAVDCTALVESLLESELFGHVKGSFTGAVQSKTGLFRIADGGTLFLDEIGNLSLTTQAKLLRVLQTRQVTPIGGTEPASIDIRLIAASNRNLRDLVASGAFRDDLFFRLNIIPIDLPPLRERSGDLRLLAAHFLKIYAAETGKEIRGLANDALAELERYPFPGNVRELENLIERAVVLAEEGIIRKEDLELGLAEETTGNREVPRNFGELRETKRLLREQAVESVERAFLLEALNRNNWNVTRAAEEVGMLRPNFQALLKKQGISSRERLIS